MANQHDIYKKILVCEDEEALSLSLKDNLIDEGFDVNLAKNGKEGLATALREKPNLILLDILMPKMDGMTMMAELRKNEWGKKVPIIILTVLEINEERMKGVMRDGPSYYLVKTSSTIGGIIEKIRTIPGFEKKIG